MGGIETDIFLFLVSLRIHARIARHFDKFGLILSALYIVMCECGGKCVGVHVRVRL